MPALKRKQWEMFAQKRATGIRLSSSYAEAYGKPDTRTAASHGSRLAKRPEVAARILELQQDDGGETVEPGTYDEGYVVQQLLENAKRALGARQVSAANRALELLGKHVGMFSERRTRREPPDPLDNMSGKQLKQFVRQKLMNLGAGTLKELGLIAIEPASSQRDEAVRYFREQLQRLDSAIQVIDPNEGQVQPPESGSQDAGVLH